MTTVETIVPAPAESVFDIGERLAGLLKQARRDAASGEIPESVLVRLADTVEALRSRLVQRAERDPCLGFGRERGAGIEVLFPGIRAGLADFSPPQPGQRRTSARAG